jgi:hypothetical protein
MSLHTQTANDDMQQSQTAGGHQLTRAAQVTQSGYVDAAALLQSAVRLAAAAKAAGIT